MKRVLYSLVFLLVAAAFHSCGKEEDFDETLLYGKWRSGTEYWVYERGHTGYTWDESDDVSEDDEQQSFTWGLVKSELTHIHLIMGKPSVPKYYTITELTATTLKYKDSFSNYSFSKIP